MLLLVLRYLVKSGPCDFDPQAWQRQDSTDLGSKTRVCSSIVVG